MMFEKYTSRTGSATEEVLQAVEIVPREYSVLKVYSTGKIKTCKLKITYKSGSNRHTNRAIAEHFIWGYSKSQKHFIGIG